MRRGRTFRALEVSYGRYAWGTRSEEGQAWRETSDRGTIKIEAMGATGLVTSYSWVCNLVHMTIKKPCLAQISLTNGPVPLLFSYGNGVVGDDAKFGFDHTNTRRRVNS